MNSHSQEVIHFWSCDRNLKVCWDTIMAQFPRNPKVLAYMQRRYASHANVFVTMMVRQLRISEPMAGVSIQQQVAAYNRDFLRYMCDYIVNHVLGSEHVPQMTVTDGLPTSRFGPSHHAGDGNCILATWYTTATNLPSARDDAAGDEGEGSAWSGRSTLRSTDVRGGASRSDVDRNQSRTGITFCDQSALGTSSHVAALMDDPSFVALNRGAPEYTNTAFGDATPASDRRLLERRIFHNNELGVENGVRMGEVRLQRRNLDRDITSSLRATGEMDGMARGYDMTPLYCRVQNKQQARAFYEPPAKPAGFVYNLD